MNGIAFIVLKIRLFYFIAVTARAVPFPVSLYEYAWLIF